MLWRICRPRMMAVLAFPWFVVAGLAIGQTVSPPSAAQSPAQPVADNLSFRDRLEAHCIDGSVIRFNLLETKISLKTEYGAIDIRSADIRRIEFAARLPAAVEACIKASIAKLADNNYEVRETVNSALLALDSVAYPAIMAACQSTDPEVANRAEILAATIRKTASSESLEYRDDDLICTDKSQIAGTIQVESLSIDTAPFGKQKISLEVLRRVESGAEVPGNVMDDPGNLVNYRNNVGKTFYFRVTGPQPQFRNGFVWGNDMYTLDSTLAMAAVHAGAVQAGQSKVVGVTILGPQGSFAGSLRNNIQSGAFGSYPGAYKFKTGRENPAGRAIVQPGVQAAPGFQRNPF